MNDTIKGLYQVIESRKENAGEGSYTAYLFEQGLDKILKKVGEESSEVIIAAKSMEQAQLKGIDDSKERDDLNNEISDLFYHVLVLMADRGIQIEEVDAILEARRQKSGNLKKQKNVDLNT